MDKKPKENKAIPGDREPYSQPAVKELGHVSALTQAGTAGNQEGMMGMGANDPAKMQ